MDTMELRNKLLKYINTADERVLRIVNAVFESYRESDTSEEEIVAYTVNGEPLTRKKYIELNDQAEAAYHQGNFTTHEQIKEKFKTRGSH